MSSLPEKSPSELSLEAELERAALLMEGWFEPLSLEEVGPCLDQAHKLYVESESTARSGIMQALDAVIRFVSSELDGLPGQIDKQLLPLMRLQRALEDLDSGVQHSCLLPRIRAVGGSKLTKDQAEFRLFCCVAVASLARNADAEVIRTRVAARLTAAGFFQLRKDRAGNPKAIAEGTLKSWERDIHGILDIVVVDNHMSFTTYMLRKCLPYSRLKLLTEEQADLGDYLLDHVIPLTFGHLRQPNQKS